MTRDLLRMEKRGINEPRIEQPLSPGAMAWMMDGLIGRMNLTGKVEFLEGLSLMNQRPHQEERPVDLVEERNMNGISSSIAMDDALHSDGEHMTGDSM